MSNWIGVGGSWKPVVGQHVGVGGAWKQIEQKWIGVGGAWKLQYSALASTVDATVSGSAIGLADTGYATTNGDPPNLVVTGGSGNYSYLWTQRSNVSGANPSIVYNNVDNAEWDGTFADGVQSHTIWYCTITDDTYGNSIVSDDVDVYLIYNKIA